MNTKYTKFYESQYKRDLILAQRSNNKKEKPKCKIVWYHDFPDMPCKLCNGRKWYWLKLKAIIRKII